MIRLFRELRVRRGDRTDYWLAGQFARKTHPSADRAIAAWSEFMGRDAAMLWVVAQAREGHVR
jgi:hypothetical protein